MKHKKQHSDDRHRHHHSDRRGERGDNSQRGGNYNSDRRRNDHSDSGPPPGRYDNRGGEQYRGGRHDRNDDRQSSQRGSWQGRDDRKHRGQDFTDSRQGPPIFAGGFNPSQAGPVPFLIPRDMPPAPWGMQPHGTDQYWGQGQNPHASFDNTSRGHGHGSWSRMEDDRKRGRDQFNDNSGSRDYSDRGRNDYGRNDEPGYSKRMRMDECDRRHQHFQYDQRDDYRGEEVQFRIDSTPNERHLKFYKINNAPQFEQEYHRADVYGATTEELKTALPFFSSFARCVRPQGIDDDGNPVDEHGNRLDEEGKPIAVDEESDLNLNVSSESATTVKKEVKRRKDSILSAVQYIQMPHRVSQSTAISQGIKEKSVRDRVEAFNIELRQKPHDIDLWRRFVSFQEDVTLEEMSGYEPTTTAKKDKDKRKSKKSVVEKKIAVIEKAIESNTKCLQLHMDRMELLYELYKPRYVLGEWKKLVTLHQQLGSFWTEYFLFSSTQLQLYSASTLQDIYEKSFQKFKLMFNTNYPAFQRPEKFPLLISDLFMGLTLVLRNSGHREKAIAFHQAQLELNFNYPTKMLEADAAWESVLSIFELFWDAGTLRFGELDAPGWKGVLQDKKEIIKRPSEVEKQAGEWEDSYFDHYANEENKTLSKVQHWIAIESSRSTFHWLPWRANYSGIDNCEDSNRLILSKEITPLLTFIPTAEAFNIFDRPAYYFRSVMNFILTLREDFLPRSQTLDSVLSQFLSLGLTNIGILMSEIRYWKTNFSVYGIDDTESQYDVPDGFDFADYISPNPEKPRATAETPEDTEAKYSEPIAVKKDEILKLNLGEYNSLILHTVESALPHLDQKYASLLAQAYIRFQQREIFFEPGTLKSRMKQSKTLLQHEKLRNSLPLYGEISKLEFFGSKNRTKSSDILVKTINSASVNLRAAAESSGEVSLNSHWEIVAELSKLYRLLAELYIKDEPSRALSILIALGNQFQNVDVTSEVPEFTKNDMLVARRYFEKLLKTLVLLEDPNENYFGDEWDGDKCVEYMLQHTSLVVEWVHLYALFLYLSEGYDECSAAFEKCLQRIKSSRLDRTTKYSPVPVAASFMREQLYIRWCSIGILEVSRNPMQNSKLRNTLTEALEEFPASPPLLTLFCDVEKQSSIAGKIWRLMTGVIKNETEIPSLHWTPLFMSLSLAKKIEQLKRDEEIGLPVFGLGGPAVPPDTIFHKLDAVLSTAEQNQSTRSCPLIWRLHLHLTAKRAARSDSDKDRKNAKAMFYDAIRFCPSVKVLYMDALHYFPEMFKDILHLMEEKQLMIRIPVEELDVLLQQESGDEDDDNEKEDSQQVVNLSSDEEEDLEKKDKKQELPAEDADEVQIVDSASDGEIVE